jgi:Bax protein
MRKTKSFAARRMVVGLERRIVLVSAVLVAATLVANLAPRVPMVPSATWDQAFEVIPLPAPPTVVASSTPDEHVTVRANSVAKLVAVFQRFGYDLDTVRARGQVPRVYLATLPPDLPDMPDVDERKLTFIQMMLPLVLKVNETISHDRARILELRDQFARHRELKPRDAEWLHDISATYGLDQDADFDELLLRVDVVPTSLAVAQAAIESGWGTSRFAHEGKALFGQYVWGASSDGLVPHDREDGKTHKIKAFDSLADAIKAYALNLDVNPAYEGFRKARAAMRAKGLDLDGYDLAAQLVNYSELRGAYVKSVRRVIDMNSLSQFDDVRLASRRAL